MTKLRLIKPWGLRIVRQHTNVILGERVIGTGIQICAGPIAAREDLFSRHRHDIRTTVGIVDARSVHRVIAPVVCSTFKPLASIGIR